MRGPIDALGNLSSTALRILWLPDNQLSGTLQSLTRLSALNTLHIKGNVVSGTLEPLLELSALSTIRLSYNHFTGIPPPALITACATSQVFCSIAPQPYMCGNQERILGYTCAACDTCSSAGSGECKLGYDNNSYLCASCEKGSFEAGSGVCTECIDPTSSDSLRYLAMILAVIVFGFAVVYAVCKKLGIKRHRFRFNLKNQIRVKQFAALFQMLGLLVSLSIGSPQWLKSIVSIFDSVALPVNAPCMPGLEYLSRWQQAIVSFVAFFAVVALLVHLKRILSRFSCLPPISSKTYMNLQILASILVIQSVVILLPLSINIEELTSDIMEGAANLEPTDNEGVFLVKVIKDILAHGTTFVGIATFVLLLVHFAHIKYLDARASFFEKDAADFTEAEQVDSLLPFWSTFCLSYVPRSADFESKALRRRIMCIILPTIIKGSVTAILSIHSAENILGDLNPVFGEIRNLRNVQLVGVCYETLVYVALNTIFLAHQLKRPYISPNPDPVYGDPLNDAEMTTTRVLCWGAILFCVKSVLLEKRGESSSWMVTGMAIALLAALGASQRPLFRGILDNMRNSGDWVELEKRKRASFGGATRQGRIEMMLDCKSAVEMWQLQKGLRGALQLESSERPRWIIAEKGRASNIYWILATFVGSLLGAVFVFGVSLVMIWTTSVKDVWPTLLTVLVILSGVAMEILYRARNTTLRKRSTFNENTFVSGKNKSGTASNPRSGSSSNFGVVLGDVELAEAIKGVEEMESGHFRSSVGGVEVEEVDVDEIIQEFVRRQSSAVEVKAVDEEVVGVIKEWSEKN
jgi:hypothetical protein